MFYSSGHLLNDRHCLNANSANPIEQINHLFGVAEFSYDSPPSSPFLLGARARVRVDLEICIFIQHR